MIQKINSTFVLNTEKTTYAFRVMETGQLEHLYYGAKIRSMEGHETAGILVERHAFQPGTNVILNPDHDTFTLNDICQELSGSGRGDTGEAAIELIFPDGCQTIDWIYDKFEIQDGRHDLEGKTLPGAHVLEEKQRLEENEKKTVAGVQTLNIYLKAKNENVTALLQYFVWEDSNVITRKLYLKNTGEQPVEIRKAMSGQLDFADHDFRLSSFHGAWTREMEKADMLLTPGGYRGGSRTGNSSADTNPFFMLARPSATEDTGLVYGMNLIYSGSHEEAISVNIFGKTRVLWGIQREGFTYRLDGGRIFEAPEAVMTVSKNGYNGMSHNMHKFVRDHVLTGKWAKKERPVLLNSWEAAYFKISESKLLNLAEAASEVGVELFVMDDGWFGERNDDKHSLGDWDVNKKKLPHGIKGLADKVKKLGMSFGLWVEPEMVNVESKLYMEHPEWVLQHIAEDHAEGRNQRVLDLVNPEVQKWLIETMSKVFSSGDISYVKWDMNRNMSDIYSPYLKKEGRPQGETVLRYMQGLYACMAELTKRFPDILFEGCASGGNRFDLGILSYFPQIWGSDDTDAICRAEIQNGYSYGYPLSCVSAHVSSAPNHQTLRVTPLETRFDVAAFGSFGYELYLADASKDEKEKIKSQIETYKKYRSVFFQGDFYRGRSYQGNLSNGYELRGNLMEWTVISEDQRTAVCLILQKEQVPNMQQLRLYPKGLLENQKYHFTNIPQRVNLKMFGDLVNTVAPVHVKQDSMTHDLLAKFVKPDGETEDLYAYGDSMMENGIPLSPAYSGTGFNEKTRVFGDFTSRLYFIQATN